MNTVAPFIVPEITSVKPYQADNVITPLSMIDRAIAGNADIATLERLMALQERHEAAQARREFDEAVSMAKSEIPSIGKTRNVNYKNSKGDETNYNHEDLAGIALVVDPILSKHGLSYRYKSEQKDSSIAITCILSHKRGHREETTLSGFNDTSGGKNAIQAVGSAATYLQRYTLKLALGLSSSNDDDNHQSEPPAKLIDDAQFRYIQDLIEKSNSDEAKFLKHLGATDLLTLTQKQYRTAESLLRKKIAMNGAKQPKKEVA